MKRTRSPVTPADLEGLYRQHALAVARFLQRQGMGHAIRDDLVQEVFLTVAVRGLPRNLTASSARSNMQYAGEEIEEGSSFESAVRRWLLGVAGHLLLNARRKHRRQRTVADHDAVSEAMAQKLDPFEWTDLRQKGRMLADALDTMSQNERAVFLAHELEEEGHEAIAAQMGRPIGTIYRLLCTARTKVLRHYESRSAIRGPVSGTLPTTKAAAPQKEYLGLMHLALAAGELPGQPFDVDGGLARLQTALQSNGTQTHSPPNDGASPPATSGGTSVVQGAQGVAPKAILAWGAGMGGLAGVVIGVVVMSGAWDEPRPMWAARSGLGDMSVAAAPTPVSPGEATTSLPAVLPPNADAQHSPEGPDPKRRRAVAPRVEPRSSDRADEKSELRFQRNLYDVASKDPARALELVEEGQARYPKGIHRVAREAIAISVLVRLGRSADARARLRMFEERHPASPLRAGLRRLVVPNETTH